jgi:hypothetical protein
MPTTIVAQGGIISCDGGEEGLERGAGHGVPFQCGIEFSDVASVVLAMVDAHGLPVHCRLQGFMGKPQVGKGETGRSISRHGVGITTIPGRGSATTDEGGHKRYGYDACSCKAADFEKCALVHGKGSETVRLNLATGVHNPTIAVHVGSTGTCGPHAEAGNFIVGA